jgi:hypothetical protein
MVVGSGAFVTLDASAVVENDEIQSGNLVGGGIWNFGELQITNSTVARNAAVHGAGVCNSGGTVAMLNATMAENTGSPDPHVTCAGGTTIVHNTILGHTGDYAGPMTSLGHNLVTDPNNLTITLHPTDLTGDPGLGPFTDTGEPGEQYFPLQEGSLAIDAGNDETCSQRDQLGEKRDQPCDIGAIEFQETAVSSQ